MYVCMCVCERDIEREKQEYHILYYFFSRSYLFRNYFKYQFSYKIFSLKEFSYIFFYIFFKFSLITLTFFYFIFSLPS